MSDTQEIDAAFEQGVEYLNSNKPAEALEVLKKALTLASTDEQKGALFYNIAVCQHRLAEDEAAIASIEQCVSHAPRLARQIRKDDDLAELSARPELSHVFRQRQMLFSQIKPYIAWLLLAGSVVAFGSSLFMSGMLILSFIIPDLARISAQERLIFLLAMLVLCTVSALVMRWSWKNKGAAKVASLAEKQALLHKYELVIAPFSVVVVLGILAAAYYTWQFFVSGEGVTLRSGAVVLLTFIVVVAVAIGAMQKNRIAATLFTAYQLWAGIYFMSEEPPTPMLILFFAFIAMYLVSGTVAIFLYHMTQAQIVSEESAQADTA